MIAAVDTGALFQLVWAAPLAVLAVTLSYGMVVHGLTRAADARAEGRTAIAGVHFAIAVVGGLLFTGALAFGLYIMTSE